MDWTQGSRNAFGRFVRRRSAVEIQVSGGPDDRHRMRLRALADVGSRHGGSLSMRTDKDRKNLVAVT